MTARQLIGRLRFSANRPMRKDWPSDCTAAIEYDAELEHLVSIWKNELFGPNYAQRKAKGLELRCPDLWGGISEELLKRMGK